MPRPKGSKNKVTKDVRLMIADIIDNNMVKMQSDLDIMEPKERVDAIIKLLGYVTPKLQNVSINDLRKPMMDEISDRINELTRESGDS